MFKTNENNLDYTLVLVCTKDEETKKKVEEIEEEGEKVYPNVVGSDI